MTPVSPDLLIYRSYLNEILHHFTKMMARTVENNTLHHRGYEEQKNCQFFGTAICHISQKDLY